MVLESTSILQTSSRSLERDVTTAYLSLDQLVLYSNSPEPPVTPKEELTAWDQWVLAYSSGVVALDTMPPPPEGVCPSEIPTSTPTHLGDIDKYGPMTSLERGAQSVRDVWEKKGYLRASLGPNEGERRRVLERFSLKDMAPGRESIDRIADLAQAFFEVPIVVISIVLDDREIFASTIGWDPNERAPGERRRIEIPLETALCPHAMQSTDEEETFIIPDAAADWRFANNPYVTNGGPISFFASANIRLPTLPRNGTGGIDPPQEKAPSKLPVGSICIVDRSPRRNEVKPFTDKDKYFLKSCADLIAREIELGFQQSRQTIQASQTEFVGAFLRSSLVNPGHNKKLDQPHNQSQTPSTTPLPDPSVSTPTKPSPLSSGPTKASSTLASQLETMMTQTSQQTQAPPTTPSSSTEPSVHDAAAKVLELIGADSVGILDLRRFLAAPTEAGVSSPSTPGMPLPSTPLRPGLNRGTSYASNAAFSSEASKRSLSGRNQGVVTVLAQAGDFDWKKAVKAPGVVASVSHALVAFYSNGTAEFAGTIPSPLQDLLPQKTAASMTLPVYDHDGQPALLVVVVSYNPYFRFEPTDRHFVENVGAVALGGLLRRRILEADKAKLAFVSQVTHELLTPLHGVRGQLDLIRTVVTPQTMKTLEPLLNVADICVASLREILDDTLTFSKMSNSKLSDRQPTLTEVNLQAVVEEVIKACWSRATQQASAFAEDDSLRRHVVDLILDYQLPVNQLWRVDVGGLKRLLFNLIGNSLKFTEKGSVTVTVRDSKMPDSGNMRTVYVDVKDTGCGMSPEFIEQSLFVPFKQHDSFIQGAGLGVSICDHIIKRMRGTLQFDSTLGVGTTASITLPLELASSDPQPRRSLGSQSRGYRGPRIISNEMAQLFASGMFPVPELPETLIERARTPVPASLSSGAPRQLRVRVEVIEDNPIARRILTTFLTKKGIEWAQAVDGVEGVEVFKTFRPHLVWTDVSMPRLNGIEAARQIREIEAEGTKARVHIVALSGLSGDSPYHSDAVNDGIINEWIVKGGPSLKILGEGLQNLQAVLAAEQRQAEVSEALAQQIRLRR